MRWKPFQPSDLAEIDRCLDAVRQDAHVCAMRDYVQHGQTSTYVHSLRVVALSYRISKWLWRLGIGTDRRSLLRGSLLHDFYLYDWHQKDRSHRWHGYHHAARALENANRYFQLSRTEQDIIRSHMWPLNLTKVPRTREALIVCIADKCCSLGELFGPRVSTI